MARRDTLTAASLLAALRADGCVVTAESGRLRVKGAFSEATWAAIVASKDALLSLLNVEAMTGEGAPLAEPTVDPLVEPVVALGRGAQELAELMVRHYAARGSRLPSDPNCPVLQDGSVFWRRQMQRY